MTYITEEKMMKLFKIVLILFLSLTIFAGCSAKQAPEQPVDERKCPVRIGLVTDIEGIDDRSFNQSAWEGIQHFATENNLDLECISYLQSITDKDYIPNLTTYADQNYDLIVASGSLFTEAVTIVSANYPNRNFLLIDGHVEAKNVMSATFAVEQGSFLVGVAAGLVAIDEETSTVGFIGGMENDLIKAYQAGFEQGVNAVNPDANILVDYCFDFIDDEVARSLAVKQYDAGATVIYQVAGLAGNGIFEEATKRDDVWVINVELNQVDEDGASTNDVLLTSMIKRVDIVSNEICTMILNKTFKGGVKQFTLENEGIGAELSTERNLTAEQIAIIEEYDAKIKAGEIVVTTETTIENGQSNDN